MRQTQLYDEEDLLPISALQHLIFCERQWALIHLEQVWEENRLTAEGNQLHETVNVPKSITRKNTRIVRSLRLRSLKHGITGIADVVEFHQSGANHQWIPYPIEYKKGKPKKDLSDVTQLCAQALCLEEMLDIHIPEGAMFYGELNHRVDVMFDETLRTNTVNVIQRLHVLSKARKTPPAIFEKKCHNCSLINLCMPSSTNGSKSAIHYNKHMSEWIQNIHNL
ncbi:MAG: CRISPR-associated protein Cas4 [Parachlamydiaceae bacterium]